MAKPESKKSTDYKYGVVSRRIWNDAAFRALSASPPSGQMLFLRLLSAPEASPIPGLIPVGRAALAEALRWEPEGFDQAMGEAITQGMVKADWEARLVWLPKAFKHNKPASTNQVRGWVKAFNEIPDSPLKTEALDALRELCASLGDAWIRAFKGDSKAKRKPYTKPSPMASGMPSPKASPKPSPKANGIHTLTLTHTLTPTLSVGEGDAPAPESEPGPEPDQAKAAIPVDRFLASFAKPGKVTRADVARWFSDLRAKSGRGVWHWDGKGYGKAADGLAKVAKAVEAESDPEATVGAAWRGFWADEKAKSAGYPFEWFAHDFGRYVADGATAPSDVAQETARKIGELAAESNRLQTEAGAALKRGDRAGWSRLNAESERAAQECERLKRGNAA